jgi:hypothetical protein
MVVSSGIESRLFRSRNICAKHSSKKIPLSAISSSNLRSERLYIVCRIKHLTITSKSIVFLPAGELFSFSFAIIFSIGFRSLSQSIFCFIIYRACLLCVFICLLNESFAVEVNKSTLLILLLLILFSYFFEASLFKFLTNVK